MALITVDILKNDNPSLYKKLKDNINIKDPKLLDFYIREMEYYYYIDKHYPDYDWVNTPLKKQLTLRNDIMKNHLWSSKY